MNTALSWSIRSGGTSRVDSVFLIYNCQPEKQVLRLLWRVSPPNCSRGCSVTSPKENENCLGEYVTRVRPEGPLQEGHPIPRPEGRCSLRSELVIERIQGRSLYVSDRSARIEALWR